MLFMQNIQRDKGSEGRALLARKVLKINRPVGRRVVAA